MEKPDSDSKYREILRYSNLAFQMIAVILVGTFLGKWLDSRIQFRFPVFLISGVIISVFGAMYQVIREISKENKKK